MAVAITIDMKDLADQKCAVAHIMIGPNPAALRRIENNIGLELIAGIDF